MTTIGHIFLGNGGQVQLQVGDWSHAYDGSSNAKIAARVAMDLRLCLKGAGPNHGGWEGGEDDALDPRDDANRTNGQHVISVEGPDAGLNGQSPEALAVELYETGGAMAQAIARALVTIDLSMAARENAAETSADPFDDFVRVRKGRADRASLTEECLDGADEDRVAGWRQYVDAVLSAAGSSE